jgi:hypothetical protein
MRIFLERQMQNHFITGGGIENVNSEFPVREQADRTSMLENET